ncbi:FecR family protein [Longitalea arenae]|uniref:FecR family protein n=1 Tax=Longitalea arenae TaxID=2812558 RepID=UPI0019675F07|nr:FecR domain-containing protein [Longitalea arenae]
MDKYSTYQTEDFLKDESFINWVLDPEGAGNQAWTTWMNSGPATKEAAQKAIEIIRTLDFKKEAVAGDFYGGLKQRIDHTIAMGQTVPAKRRTIQLSWLKAAAAIAGLILLGWVFFNRKPSYTYFSTPYAAIKTVWLPDSTEVVLNANSSVRYNKNRLNNTREVLITGEAFFKVRHVDINGKAQAFKVYAGNTEIEVLGTEFNVRSTHEATAVMLRAGKVRFSITGSDAEKIMQPNDYCFYNKAQGTISTRTADPVMFTSWMEHKYRFENATIKEVCETLKAYFGYDFILRNDALNTQTVSGTLELQNEQVMWQVLSELFNAKVAKQGNQVVIQ